MLTKITVEATLNAELDEHLGYSKYHKSNYGRNGSSTTTIITDDNLKHQEIEMIALNPRSLKSNRSVSLLWRIKS